MCSLLLPRSAASWQNKEALADFMYDNMTLEMNAIHSAWKNGCKKLEFLGSSCIYPPYGSSAHEGKLPADQ